MNNPKILDNSILQFQLKTYLTELLTSNKYTEFSVATGYWDLPGVLELLLAIEVFLGTNMLSEIRFLIGEEPKVRVNQLDTSFPEKYIKEDLKDLPFKPEYQHAARFLSAHLDSGRIKVKLYKRSFLHAKCYIVGSEKENAIGIIGSSNFTRSGLLGNTELNDVESDHRIVNYVPKGDTQDPSHRSWFDKLWHDEMNVDWNRQFKMEILGLSKFGDLTYSPYEMYIRILYEIYGEDIEIEEKLKADPRFESRVNLTLFQEESHRKVMSKLTNDKIGMCLVGDSVGLGKSFIARKVIEEFGYYMRKNVVVVCPASLREDWINHLKEITVNGPVYSITEFSLDDSFMDIKRDLLQRKHNSKSDNAVDLLVIDESHNLKTQGSKSFQNLLQLITDKDYCSSLPKVLMLSATPVNNGIKDLANQILLAKGGNEKFFAHFGIPNLLSLFGSTQREFKLRDSEEIFACLYPILNKIMVKRTKHQVKKDFPDALLNGEPIIFPEERLENVLYELDSKDVRKAISERLRAIENSNKPLYDFFTSELSESDEEREEKQGIMEFFKYKDTDKRKKVYQTEFESIFHFIDMAIKGLRLIPYSYLTEKRVKTEEEEIQANARKSLTGVMKVSMFKSFDSSVYTFKKRIDKYESYLSNFEQLFFGHNKIVKPVIIQKAMARHQDEPDEDVLDLIFDEIDKFNEREQEKKRHDNAYRVQNPYIEINHDDYKIDDVNKFIQQDKEILTLIKSVLGDIKTDTKLNRLKERLKTLKGNKVLIFSYFATTIDYLKQELDKAFLSEIDIAEDKIEFLKSKTSKNKQAIVQRFSPKAQRHEPVNGLINGEPELQILCSTDVLSEGQNLQDCGIIINYDLHWNPVKMIQRNGRINRLGSTFKEIFIYNFRPEAQLDKFLQLMKKLQEKIKVIGYSVGIDSSVLGEQITEKQFGLIDSIYSGSRERQDQAMEELERENDLAFDEAFENDLREFMRKASDEEKENIRNLNFNKYCGIPALKGDDKMIAFNVGKGEFDFIRTDGNKVAKESNQLMALRQIRSFDTERRIERLSFEDKLALEKKAMEIFESDRAYQTTIEDIDLESFTGVKQSGGATSLARYKDELLRLLQGNIDRYSTDNVNRIKSLLTSRNLSVDNRIRSYLRKYDNQVSIDLLDTLAILSANMIKNEAPQEAPEPVLWFGYHALEAGKE
ncbi:MAG: DEAD/DEAH box helicase family protein [Nitrospirae bacterium]|nr:DEAD/DEAH box helicase family protein [Nitrospirota bacterium]